MFKLVNFLTRKPGMSPAAFREHYENSHVPIALRTFPQIVEHRRNYPLEGGAFFPEGIAQPWDCISEIWFADRRGFDDLMKFMSDPALNTEVAKDGECFLDGSKCAMLLVDETTSTRR
jgi:hypothetical protein